MVSINKVNNFDLLRLILAVLVVFAHWNTATQSGFTNFIFSLSGYSVDMFFIISGFLIFWSFDKNNIKKDFFIKRFFRIYPLYLVVIIAQTLFFVLFSNETDPYLYIKYFVVNIFYLNFLSPSVGATFDSLYVNAINASLWTLKIEVIFYILVPIIYIFYKKIGIKFIIFLYIISLCYLYSLKYLHISNHLHIVELLKQFPGQLRFFIVGILSYIIYRDFNKKYLYFLSGVSLLILIYFYINKNQDFTFVLYPLLLGVLVFFFVFILNYIKITFDFSYSIYIIHFPIIQIILYFNVNPNNPFISLSLILCIVFALGYILEKYIEKRFTSFGRQFIKKDL